MCGISGCYNYKTRRPADETAVLATLESMRYRGPDHLGICRDGDLVMGNVRLAIQGTDPSGNQPIYNEDRSVAVVYSGEIYNYPELKKQLEQRGHVFKSGTDTEVLVHLYEEHGEGLASELNGMFAFALFDRSRRSLLLARDRSGQKPLYVEETRQGIYFASELKAMIPRLESRSLDRAALRTFLSMGYCLEPQTVLEGVSALPPGEVHAFGREPQRRKSFRPFEQPPQEHPGCTADWLEKAGTALQEAVRRHLLSDVPVTVLLSGGVDSSLLALCLAGESKIKKAYTGSFVDSTSHDEYAYARTLGEHCGFEVERVMLSNRELADRLEAFLDGASLPQGDNSGLATYCVARQVARDYRVVLGGDGGDELFGGYPTYTFPFLSRRYGFVPHGAIGAARRIAALLCDRQKYLSLPFRLQQLSLAWGRQGAEAHFALKDFLPDPLAAEVLERSFFGGRNLAARQARACITDLFENTIQSDSVLKRLCFTDFGSFLQSGTIPKVERNSMRYSLEARMPFLDNRLIDFSLGTAPDLLARGLETKRGLKALLAQKTRGKIRLNPVKQGFNPPAAALLDNELKEWRLHWLNFKSPLFRPGLPAALHKWRRRGWDLHRLEWHICALGDWCCRNRLL